MTTDNNPAPAEPEDTIRRVREHLLHELKATVLCWALPGPEGSSVAWVQCWATQGMKEKQMRLVIVEIYQGGGFDVFPQILSNRKDQDARIIEAMRQAEATPTDA